MKCKKDYLLPVLMDKKQQLAAITYNLEKKRGLRDFFYFNTEILGYDATERTHLGVHKYMMDRQNEDKGIRKMVLMPRYSYKTSLITVGYALWRLCRDYNLRVLIASEAYDPQTTDILRMIRAHLERNQKLRALYGEFDAEKDKRPWKIGSMEIAQRTLVDRNPSLGAGSVGRVDTGSHYDLVLLDDIVSKNNIDTSEQIQKVVDYWKAIHSVLSPKGELVLVGTRWHFDDLYGYIIDDEALHKRYNPYVEQAIEVKEGETLDGALESRVPEKLFFPEELSYDFLELQRETQGDYLFSCLYQNDPLPTSEQDFKPDWIQTYKDEDLEGRKLSYTYTIEPAISQKRSACDTVILVCASDTDGNLYVIDYFRGKLVPNEIINKTYAYAEMYPPKTIGLETNAFQQSLKYGFGDEAQKRNWYLPIKELNVNQEKDSRIRAIQPRFAARKVFIRRRMTDLRRDLLRFPKISKNKKDLLDALASQVYLIRPVTENKKKVQAHPRSFEGLMKDMRREKRRQSKIGAGKHTFDSLMKYGH